MSAFVAFGRMNSFGVGVFCGTHGYRRSRSYESSCSKSGVVKWLSE